MRIFIGRSARLHIGQLKIVLVRIVTGYLMWVPGSHLRIHDRVTGQNIRVSWSVRGARVVRVLNSLRYVMGACAAFSDR